MRMVTMDDGVRLRTWTTGTPSTLPRPASAVAALAAAVPGARLHVIDGAGRQPWRERPAELATVLRGVIESGAACDSVQKYSSSSLLR